MGDARTRTPEFRATATAVALIACLGPVACERVDPAAASGSATLEWTMPDTPAGARAEVPIAGYTVFYGPTPRALYSTVAVPDAHARRYVVRGLAPGTWYFAVAAYTPGNVQGARSNIASKTVP